MEKHVSNHTMGNGTMDNGATGQQNWPKKSKSLETYFNGKTYLEASYSFPIESIKNPSAKLFSKQQHRRVSEAIV